jgi:hypothetical protein
MRNLKKALSLILVFAFALSFAASAAFTDVKVNDDYAVEIGALSNLEILTAMKTVLTTGRHSYQAESRQLLFTECSPATRMQTFLKALPALAM